MNLAGELGKVVFSGVSSGVDELSFEFMMGHRLLSEGLEEVELFLRRVDNAGASGRRMEKAPPAVDGRAFS